MTDERDFEMPYPLRPYPKLIINAAITGMVPTKADNPNVPISIPEIIDDAIRCCRAGASIIHIHARDKNGVPSSDRRIYAEIIEGIRTQCPDVIICVSASGRLENSFEKRSDVLNLDGALKPDMASLTLGSFNFLRQASVNSPETIEKLAGKMRQNAIVPEMEIFDTGMINAAKVLVRKGILREPFYCNLLLGSAYTAPATLFDLACMVKNLPAGFHWAAAGLGKFQLNMNIAAIVMGGNVRVGLEDNIYYDSDKRVLATNELLIERVVHLAGEIGREIANPLQARQIIGLAKPVPTKVKEISKWAMQDSNLRPAD
jgi:3-keto-5-aminohexanoate cleavage enzyme